LSRAGRILEDRRAARAMQATTSARGFEPALNSSSERTGS
jgi:hypothetical protein